MRYVYFVQGGTTGLIKIGSAKDPQRRMANMQSGCAERLDLLGMIPEDGRMSEGRLQAELSSTRVRGEWFTMSDRLREIIKSSSTIRDDSAFGLPVGTRIRTSGVLGSLIKAYRIKRGLTQAELAAKMRVSRQWVVEVEHGKARAEVGLVFSAVQVLDIPLGVVKS
jgi:DNA-binding XRE family transcriptional regulator